MLVGLSVPCNAEMGVGWISGKRKSSNTLVRQCGGDEVVRGRDRWDQDVVEWVRSAIVCRSHDNPFPFGVLTAWRQVSQKSLYGRRLLCPCAQPARLDLGVGSRRLVR